MRQLTLADGLTVFSLNPDETRFVHREVFAERCYLQHGIELHDEDCVLDVGANIGLSSVFFHRECKGVSLYAIEPSPGACECLRSNFQLHGVNGRIFECGLSSKSGSAEFTYYPANTVRSGFHVNLEVDRDTTKTYMVNSGIPERKADLFLGYLFKKETFILPLKTLSEIIDQEQITRIDLLKIDAERSEMEILAGIRDEHWGLVRQIVLELQDEMGAMDKMLRLLSDRGFQVVTEQDPLLKGTAVFGVFASRALNQRSSP